MAFFSKLKKAKEAAQEHKKEAATVQEEVKPKVPYKHVPVHAAIDSLAATPTTMNSEELRERIKAARRKSMSSASVRSSRSGVALYQSATPPNSRSRPSSVISAPGSISSAHSRSGSLGKRTNSDLSISTMMQSHQEIPSRGRQPARRDYFSHGSGIPAVPQVPAQHRPKPQKTLSSRSSIAKRKSPLSAMSITEDDEADDPSSSSSQASDASVASSQSSATEISRPNSSQDHNKDMIKDMAKELNNYSRPLSTTIAAPVAPVVVPQFQHKKHQSVIEVTPQPSLSKTKSLKKRFSLFSRKSAVVAAH